MKNLTIKAIEDMALSAGAIETCLTGQVGIKTITCKAVAAVTEGSFIQFADGNGVYWGVALDKNGGGLANAGAYYLAGIAAGKMAIADLSGGAASAADVAAICVTQLKLLAGFTAAFTLVDNLDGTITATASVRNPITGLSRILNAVEAPSTDFVIADAQTGLSSAVSVSGDTLALSSTSFVTGDEIVLSISSGSLPSPLAAGAYFAIKTGASTIKVAATHAQALAGIFLNLTDQGTAGSTITVAKGGIKSTALDISGVITISVQLNVEYDSQSSDAVGTVTLETSNDNINFLPVAGSTQPFSKTNAIVAADFTVYSNWVRFSVVTISGGDTTLDSIVVQKILPGY